MKTFITFFVALFFVGISDAYCESVIDKILRVFPEYDLRSPNLTQFGVWFDSQDSRIEYDSDGIFYMHVSYGTDIDDLKYEIYSQLMLSPSTVSVTTVGMNRIRVYIMIDTPAVYVLGNQIVIYRRPGDTRTLDDFPDQ